MENKRHLICDNEIIEFKKKHNPLQLRVFYNLLYAYKDAEFKQGYDEEKIEEIEVDLEYLKICYDSKKASVSKAIELIQTIPKGVFSKDNKKYISTFGKIEFDEEYMCFKFTITDEFKPLLDKTSKSSIEGTIKRFTVLELKEFSFLTSKYSQRTYELICKYRKLENNYTMPIDKFKKFYDIPKSYAMSDIDKRIIKVSEKEINDFTKYELTINKVKNKNKVTHMEFIIKEK